MHLTPSAASQQVRQLGRELGVVLLEPHGRNVRLTEAARTLLALADAIEARWEQAEIDLRSAKDEPAGLLRLCSMPTAVSRLPAPVVAPLTAKYPKLKVQLREVEQQQAFDLLFAGEADLAVIEVTPANPPRTDARFDQRPLTDDVFDLADFAREDWIISPVACICREHTLAACGAAGFTPHIAHDALEWNAIGHLVAHGLGVALVPRLAYLAPQLPVKRLSLADPPSRKLLTCTRGGGFANPAIAAAHDALVDVAA
jgi:DNA-binding transcriptional LysR family regulator